MFVHGLQFFWKMMFIHYYPLHTPMETQRHIWSVTLAGCLMDTMDPGGGDTRNFWWGCAASTAKSRPNFRPKNAIFHTCFQTWPQKSVPVFRPDLENIHPFSDSFQSVLNDAGQWTSASSFDKMSDKTNDLKKITKIV